ncbi:MAG: hypothetical protein HY513_05160 [Candidatus Aenigmarchaeota archaeon]|nr:hypothetical protein [Candidatus Aenigmarchaeota archaeon]
MSRSRFLVLPTTGRAYRVSERNNVLEALAFYLSNLERGEIFYTDVFRDVAYANLHFYPKQVMPFLKRAERLIPDIVSCRL